MQLPHSLPLQYRDACVPATTPLDDVSFVRCMHIFSPEQRGVYWAGESLEICHCRQWETGHTLIKRSEPIVSLLSAQMRSLPSPLDQPKPHRLHG
jgi:hypothetical protein